MGVMVTLEMVMETKILETIMVMVTLVAIMEMGTLEATVGMGTLEATTGMGALLEIAIIKESFVAPLGCLLCALGVKVVDGAAAGDNPPVTSARISSSSKPQLALVLII